MFGRSGYFIERSLMGALSFFKQSIFAETYAAKRYFLQKRDTRIKTISFLLLLLSVLYARHIYFILAIYSLILLLVKFSGISLIFFLKRTWIFIPLFSLFIAVPALFSVFSPGEPVFVINLFNLKAVITKQGLSAAAIFIVRVITSVSIVILLTITTRHNELLKALRIFGIPQVFVMTLGMCYRYIYLFVEIIENTYLAIKSRVGLLVRQKEGRRIVAWSMANLWQRSYCLSGQVYAAMLSRGYRGEPKIYNELKTDTLDWTMLGFVLTFFILVLIKTIGA